MPTDHVEVAIIGAGPVGLLLGCLLGSRGIGTLILEKSTELPAQSQAIGITPPSLEILAGVDLDGAFIEKGLGIEECIVHGASGRLGHVDFRGIASRYRFILSLPQAVTLSLLQAKVVTYPCVKLLQGCEVTEVIQTSETCRVTWLDSHDLGTHSLTTAFAVACDGSRSRLRDSVASRVHRQAYGCHFIMGDFEDRTALGSFAHVFFMPGGAVESFPLPSGLRRWIVQAPESEKDPSAEIIPSTVRTRTGIDLSPADQINQSAFTPRRLECRPYHRGHILLCGDAAHVMSPIGGQGMNIGFADAEHLAGILWATLREGQEGGPLFSAYSRERRRAAALAATRAAAGMWIGTWLGHPASVLRDWIIGSILLGSFFAPRVASSFAMLGIPRAPRILPPASAPTPDHDSPRFA